MEEKLTDQHFALLVLIKKTRTRPSVSSDEWDLFLDLADAGCVEDIGLGDARLTSKGRYALTPAGRAALSASTDKMPGDRDA